MAHGPSHERFGAHWFFGENSWYAQSGLKEMITGQQSEPSGTGTFGRLGSFDLNLGDQEMMLIGLIGAVVIYIAIK